MSGYMEFKEALTAKSNAVAANKARKAYWQGIANMALHLFVI